MGVFLITYDLSSDEKEYVKLFDLIKEYGTWWHHLESVWIVRTEETAGDIRDNLKSVLNDGDKLLVASLKGSWATRFVDKKGTGWLGNRKDDF